MSIKGTLKYYWEDYGDIERSSDCANLQTVAPMVWFALQQYKLAKLAVSAAIDEMPEDD